ncbi:MULTISPECIES: pitrilysin family protein [unclassified Devosia]|uniref:M16 family metallopeptidase n=1 Tax=unclassified Devosia TaxID=196773 RepID=UPI00092957D7|nr:MULTISPECIES: pitrilysin family protein [unclassified Devosia]MBL8596485.1 insulinase family protein [Devosia sp.]OJX51281.1 MAG: peptidase M16 [Devosia sp. 66-22]
MSVRTTTLDNGMTVITDDMPHLESASLGIWVKAGSRSETLAEHGVSHVLEHMAFKGTASRTALEIAETIENVGGDLNAATSVEHTGYFARVLREDVPLAADILSDILQNSLFDQNELDREQQVIVQEIGAARDNPDDHVFDLFQEAAFPDQPIGRTILGTVDSVKSFSPATVRDYMERNYVGDQMVVCAAGNVDHEALVDIAANRFHDLRTSGAPVPQKAKYVGGESRILSEHEQAHIVLGFEGRAYNSDGFYAAQILASILGGGMSSRLFQEVREKRGLCYSVYAFHWAFADSGIFGVAASTGEDEVTDLIPVVIDELLKATETITDEEVLRVRNQIRAGLLMSLESPSSRAGQLARQQILWGRPIPLQETVDRINRITADRVKLIARQVLDKGAFSLAGIGPVAKLPDYDAIASRLKH